VEGFSLIGKSISHYPITEKLGAGGMGEVFRTHDATLCRQVAICSLLLVAAVRAGINCTAAIAAATTVYGKTCQALGGLLG
jgi:hypothetical protein